MYFANFFRYFVLCVVCLKVWATHYKHCIASSLQHLYLDHIIIFSTSIRGAPATSLTCPEPLAKHLNHLKLRLCQKKVGYLGQVVCRRCSYRSWKDKGSSKVETNPKELRSPLGFASYYRRFVEADAKIAAHLHQLVAQGEGSRNKHKSHANSTLRGHGPTNASRA